MVVFLEKVRDVVILLSFQFRPAVDVLVVPRPPRWKKDSDFLQSSLYLLSLAVSLINV